MRSAGLFFVFKKEVIRLAKDKTISIMILALVAIIAVIGIVMMFKGGAEPGKAGYQSPTITSPNAPPTYNVAPRPTYTVTQPAPYTIPTQPTYTTGGTQPQYPTAAQLPINVPQGTAPTYTVTTGVKTHSATQPTTTYQVPVGTTAPTFRLMVGGHIASEGWDCYNCICEVNDYKIIGCKEKALLNNAKDVCDPVCKKMEKGASTCKVIPISNPCTPTED